MDQGYVYILTNPSFRGDWVKIGKSSRLPEVRSKELYNTAVPLPYEIYATLKTSKYSEAERNIHKFIDMLTDLRINKGREFFNIEPHNAAKILENVASLLDDAEVEYWSEGKKVMTSDGPMGNKKINRFDFYEKGMKDGNIISFIKDPTVTAEVVGNTEVLFEGEHWKLSPLAYELFNRRNELTKSGAYQGAAYFTFDGKKLKDL